jgi:AraC-like DNA-binding protein
MNYQEYAPADKLKPFILTYYTLELNGEEEYFDTAFATGCVEMMFNIGEGIWQTKKADGYQTHPSAELWGQVLEPISFKAIGKNNRMFGVRFYPESASLFLDDDVFHFNNQISSLHDAMGNDIPLLHERIFEAASIQEKINIFDQFFLSKLIRNEKYLNKTRLVKSALTQINLKEGYLDLEKIANQYNISSRYLNKLFVQNLGVSPKQYHQIIRFQQSLQLLNKGADSLTTIAYQSGYFDQSHFIKEFKKFTHTLPSDFQLANNTAILASPLK